jgi:hypothetical protein
VRAALDHLLGRVVQERCLLPIACSDDDLGAYVVAEGHEQADGGAKLRLSVFARDCEQACPVLPKAVWPLGVEQAV